MSVCAMLFSSVTMDFINTIVLVGVLTGFTNGQLDFGDSNGFRLTASKTFFESDDDVTLTCTKTANQDSGNRARSLVFPGSKGITWERNGQTLFSTYQEGGGCHVEPELVLGRPAVTQNYLDTVTCEEDSTSARVTIRNVSISGTGERWVCSRFPFLQSNAVSLHQFVALSDVTLSVEDHYPNDVNTGVLMTLICTAAPCNPPPSVKWVLKREGHALPVPGQSRSRSQVDSYGRVVMTSELAVPADPLYEQASVTCRASNTDGVWVTSNTLNLSVQRPPRILLTADPSNEVMDGATVTLTCRAHGHPQPGIRWRKEGGYLPGGLLQVDTPVVRLSPARAPDEGQYLCRASNGVPPDALNSIYLRVKEPMRTLKISDADRSTEIEDNSPWDTDNKSSDSHTTTASSANIHSPGDDHMDDSSDGGTIAAVVVSLVVVLVAAGVVAVCWMNKRRKQSLSSPGSTDSLFSHYPERSMTAPRAGVYAPRSSQRPTTFTPLTLDAFPQYLELPPAPSPPGGVTNRGYGLTHNGRKRTKTRGGRPLPDAPASDSGNDLDYGYDEILDVTEDGSQMTSSDGYEIPVLREEEEAEEEEECIYDVARLEPSIKDAHSIRRPMYMNEDSFSTHM